MSDVGNGLLNGVCEGICKVDVTDGAVCMAPHHFGSRRLAGARGAEKEKTVGGSLAFDSLYEMQEVSLYDFGQDERARVKGKSCERIGKRCCGKSLGDEALIA